MLSQSHVQLIDMKRWADAGLYEVAGRAMETLAAPEATLMLRVLDHIHTVDCIFQHHLQGRPHGFTAASSEVLPGFESLAKGAAEVLLDRCNRVKLEDGTIVPISPTMRTQIADKIGPHFWILKAVFQLYCQCMRMGWTGGQERFSIGRVDASLLPTQRTRIT